MDTTKGAFGRALLKKLGLSDAPDAKKACVLVALEDICSLLFLDDFELADRYLGGEVLPSMIYGSVIEDVHVEALMRCASGDADTTTLLGAAGVTAKQIKSFVREYAESTPQQNATYYTVAMCSIDLDRATHIEVFEHTREALLKYYAGYDTELLGKQIVYEVTVAFGKALLQEFGLSNAPDAQKACALISLEYLCKKMFRDDPKLEARYPGWETLQDMIYEGIILDESIQSLMMCASTSENVDGFPFEKHAGTTEDVIESFIKKYAKGTSPASKEAVTCYAMALRYEDVQTLKSIEVFPHAKDALSQRVFNETDPTVLGNWVVYEVTVKDYVAASLTYMETPMKEILSIKEIGSLLKFLYPETPNLTGSGYWVEGDYFGCALEIAESIEGACGFAKYRAERNKVRDFSLGDKQLYNVFFETDCVFVDDYLNIPEHHIQSKIPLGKVGDLCPDLC